MDSLKKLQWKSKTFHAVQSLPVLSTDRDCCVYIYIHWRSAWQCEDKYCETIEICQPSDIFSVLLVLRCLPFNISGCIRLLQASLHINRTVLWRQYTVIYRSKTFCMTVQNYIHYMAKIKWRLEHYTPMWLLTLSIQNHGWSCAATTAFLKLLIQSWNHMVVWNVI